MAKKTKVKLPKRIAGVKIPKTVRKGPVSDFLNSSAGQLILAEALIAAGGVFGLKKARDAGGMAGVGRRLGGRAAEGQEKLAHGSTRLAFALTEAARAFKAALSAPDAAIANFRPRAERDHEGGKEKRPAPEQPAAH